jgi:acetyltransferase-like isoleucine patch superfamily enzyme
MGMCYRTKLAKELNTDKYDGSIYYQLWLSGNIALNYPVYVSAFPTVKRRCGLNPDFGNSCNEKKSVVGNYYSSQSFVKYVSNMLKIADDVAIKNNAIIFKENVYSDFSKYSYPFLAPVRNSGVGEFVKHYSRLKKTGIGHGWFFNLYFISLLFLGRRIMDKLLLILGGYLSTTSILWNKKLTDEKR